MSVSSVGANGASRNIWHTIVLLAWGAIIVAGASLGIKFLSERGFALPPVPGTTYYEDETSYTEFFGDDFGGAQAVMVLSHEAPVIAMTNSSTCKIKPALEGIGPNTFKLDLSCENEFAAGGGCITSQQLQHEVYSLVQTFMSDMMSQQNLSHFLETHVQPMLEAAPDVVACPQVGNTLGQSLASVSSKVQESLHEEMPDCKTSMLSFWTLPAQQIQRNLSFQDWNFEVTVQLPAGSFWSVFQELLSSKDQTQVLLAVQAHSCNGSPVKDFSPEARQVVSILREVAEDVSNVSDLKAKVMSFAIIVEAIRDGVEIVMAISTATLPLGIAVLAYMVGNARLVIIAVVNVLAAVTGSVLVMEFVVTKLMSVSIFTPPFLIAVVLAMSIDYSLFLLSRFQKETEEPDVPTEVAIRVVMSTSGRIVAQAGVTLACCFSCLLMIPVQLVSAMGAGGLVAVSVAVASSTTLTPALILGTRPSFWRPQKMSKPTCLQRCLRSPNPPDVEAGNDAVDRQVHVSFGFWQRFGQGLKKAAGPVLFFILLLALPCVWKDSFGLPEDMLGLENALPAGSSTTKTLSSIGEAFGYEAILPTGLVLESPPENDTARDQWRLQACHALQKISSEVAKEVGSFTSSAFMGEVMIGGHCLVDDLAGSLLQWSRRSGRDGTVIYVDYPLDPLSPSGQAWTKSLQRAVKKHEIGKWFVQGFGPLMSSQKEKIQELFPKLIISMVCAVLVISTLFTHSFLSSLRALLCLSCTLAVLWCLSSMVFPSGLYYLVPSMMLPFMVGVALDYDIFYTEAVLEECQAGISVKEAGIRALGKTANTISAAGVIMIIAFCPLLLSSTLVLKQIGFMAIGALFMSAFWNTKVVIPVCLQVLGKYSFWPRKFKKRSGPDAIFLMHPAYLVDSFCLFTSPDTDKQWVPSWWMYLFLPFLWLMGFCMAHVLRRLGLPNYLVVDEYKYNGLLVQSWAVLHFGRHFRNSWELYDARLNVAAAARHAEQTGARVLGLGALNKAEFLNRGGLDLLEHLPADRSMCITHGDHLTAAAVVENVLRLVGKCSGKPFLTGAISKTGKAVALALLRRGVPVICHSKSQEAREELETYGLETASHLRHGSKCDLWIIGKYDVFVNDAMPPSAAGQKGALFFLLFVVCVAGNEYGVTLTCGDGEMTVSLVKSLYPTLNASRLHLNDASCRATENTSYITFYTSLDGCGTTRSETESWFTFYNQIKGEIGQIGSAVTRDHDFDMHFNCSYQRKEFLSLTFQPNGILRPPITDGFGNLTFKMDIYKSDSYKEAYVDNEYPLNVALNDYIHLGYSVESSQLLVVMAVNCKATKDKDFGSSPYYELIKDGCSQDTSMENDYDPTQSFQKFKFRAFRFFNDYAAIHLHCELMACYNNTSSSRCSQGCQPSTGSKRRKREVSEESLPTTTKAYKIGRGPIQFFEKKANAKDAGSTGKQAAVIAGATVGGGVGLAFIICAAVLFVKYRIARVLFKNPNKVGNLYTTREECESRQSSYIEEDDHDMIERNEIL